jgi:hypothetical protein
MESPVSPGSAPYNLPQIKAAIKRQASSALLFLLIPFTFVISVAFLTQAKGPQWLPLTFENPYNYLFNSLLLLKGDSPYSIYHPGTTTQVFGAIVLRVSSLETNDGLIETVLRDPEKYIRILHWALLIFTASALWVAPWLTATVLKNRIIGLLIQIPCLFCIILLRYGILFGPDLMLVPFSVATICCCALLMVPSDSTRRSVILFGIGDEETGHYTRLLRLPLLPAITGFICALGIVTKLTFFPLILISLLCCQSKKNLFCFSITFILGVAIALLPIYSQLPQLATWAIGLGIHSGQYNAGAVGLPQSGVYLASLSYNVQAEPLVTIIPIAATTVVLAFYFLARRQTLTDKIAWRISVVLFTIQAISFLLIAKESGTHYLIPLSLTTGLNLIFLFQTCRSMTRAPLKKILAWVALIGLIGLGFKSFIEKTAADYARLSEDRFEQLRLYRHAQEITKNDVRVDYFFSDSPIYPLCYGNNCAGGAFGSTLLRIYPNKLFFNVFNGQFQTFTQWFSPETIIRKYDHLYFLGTPKWFPRVDGFEPDTFETVDQAGEYTLQKWTRK